MISSQNKCVVDFGLLCLSAHSTLQLDTSYLNNNDNTLKKALARGMLSAITSYSEQRDDTTILTTFTPTLKPKIPFKLEASYL
jgi:hypothetical protein